MSLNKYTPLEKSIAEDQKLGNENTDIEAAPNGITRASYGHMLPIVHNGKEKLVPKAIYQDVMDMRKYINVRNRKLPRKFGRTIIIRYDKDNAPTMTIGPHIPLSICLIVTILVLSVVFTYSMIREAFVMCLVGLLIVLIHLASFLTTMLMSPGIPSTNVTEEDITAVIENKRTWCEKCKVVMTKHTEHCEDCECCVQNLDHHCPWTGKCIAEGNIIPFNLFLVMTFVLIVYYGFVAVLVSINASESVKKNQGV